MYSRACSRIPRDVILVTFFIQERLHYIAMKAGFSMLVYYVRVPTQIFYDS